MIAASDSYDAVPYPTRAQTPIHPDRLAALGLLFGLNPPAVSGSRILEIGCGDGGNLIPIAAALPENRCEGIDSSPAAIARGREFTVQSGLENVSLRCARVDEPAAVAGQFDYILCHGVFSWVPEPVREAILEVCDRHLAPNGLAVVTYNAMPGGYARQAVRHMLLWHVRDLSDASERIEEARALTQLLEERMVEPDAHAGALRAELHMAREKEAGHFFHDDLAGINEPFFLHEFMTRATRHRLRYVADADLTDLVRPVLPEDLRRLLAALSDDRLEREQYMDFLVARRFRQTILCRADQVVAEAPVAGRLTRCWFSSPASNATPDKVSQAGAVAAFEKLDGPRLQTDFLPAKLVMARLAEVWPRRLSFEDLEAGARASMEGMLQVPPWSPQTREALCTFLLEAASARLVLCHACSPSTTTAPGPRPRAFAPARVLARSSEFVVSAFHQILRLEQPAARALLEQLDGTRSREELLQIMVALAPATPPGQAAGWPTTAADLELALAKLAGHGLLVE